MFDANTIFYRREGKKDPPDYFDFEDFSKRNTVFFNPIFKEPDPIITSFENRIKEPLIPSGRISLGSPIEDTFDSNRTIIPPLYDNKLFPGVLDKTVNDALPFQRPTTLDPTKATVESAVFDAGEDIKRKERLFSYAEDALNDFNGFVQEIWNDQKSFSDILLAKPKITTYVSNEQFKPYNPILRGYTAAYTVTQDEGLVFRGITHERNWNPSDVPLRLLSGIENLKGLPFNSDDLAKLPHGILPVGERQDYLIGKAIILVEPPDKTQTRLIIDTSEEQLLLYAAIILG